MRPMPFSRKPCGRPDRTTGPTGEDCSRYHHPGSRQRFFTGLARQLLITLLKAGHTLIVSGEFLYEAAKVLRYPRFRKFHSLTEDGIYQYVAFLRDVAEIVTLDPTLTVPIRDVNDIIVAQTAILGEADFLCTMDEDFYDPVTPGIFLDTSA